MLDRYSALFGKGLTLAGSVMPGTDPVQVPQGADCNSITAFAYAQAESAEPRAVLGMLGIDGRELMCGRFRDDILTLTLPIPPRQYKGTVLSENALVFLVPKKINLFFFVNQAGAARTWYPSVQVRQLFLSGEQ